MIIKQITSLLLSPTEKLKVQISVGLSDARGNASYCSLYNADGRGYQNVTPYIPLTLKYFEPTRRWSKLDNVSITPRTIGAVRTDLDEFYKKMMAHEDDIFSYNQAGYISSIGNTKPYTRVIPLEYNQALRLSPIALYATENGRPIPGVSMELNCKENRVDMSINEFEMFNDLMQTVQIHQEGMLLLHMYMTICLKNGGLTIPLEEGSGARQPSSKDVRINIFEAAEKKNGTHQEEEFVSGPDTINQPKSLEELP